MKIPILLAACAAALLGASPHANADAPKQTEQGHRQIYADLTGTTVLENDKVIVQRFVIQPSQSTGRRTQSARQLLVFVKGGVLKSKATGRSTLWPDGRVVWQERPGRADEGSTNTGAAPIELLWATLKPTGSLSGSAASEKAPRYGYLNYPNVAGEDVLENDWVIVQRFKLNPGQWEGIHAHNPNTFYIFIKGGRYLSKSRQHPQGIAGTAEDGTVAWMDTIDISDEHQSGNTGTTAAEVVWVSLKR